MNRLFKVRGRIPLQASVTGVPFRHTAELPGRAPARSISRWPRSLAAPRFACAGSIALSPISMTRRRLRAAQLQHWCLIRWY